MKEAGELFSGRVGFAMVSERHSRNPKGDLMLTKRS